MLQAGDCDASAEACVPEEALIRPGAGDLWGLTSGYLTETFLLLIAPLLAAILFTGVSVGFEIILLFTPALVAFYAYIVPFVLTVIYALFGGDGFLFGWVDVVLGFLIEHYLSNVQLLFPLVVLGVWQSLSSIETDGNYWSLEQEANEYHLATVLLELVIVFYYWDRTMFMSVDAIRHLRPTWQKVLPGKRLWPSLFYLLGLRERDHYGRESSESKQDADSTPDDLKDQIVTLMADF